MPLPQFPREFREVNRPRVGRAGTDGSAVSCPRPGFPRVPHPEWWGSYAPPLSACSQDGRAVWVKAALGLPGPRLLAGAASGWALACLDPTPTRTCSGPPQVRLFQDEEIYSDPYLTVCEWPSDASKVIVFA